MPDNWVYVGGPSGTGGLGGAAQALAAHAALLPIGDGGCILYYGGSQWTEPKTWEAVEIDANPMEDPLYQAALAEIDHTRIFDCATNVVTNPLTPPTDLFCSGHAFLVDGRLAVAGGTQHFPADAQNWHHDHFRKTSSYPPTKPNC
jgi:hypothetical protein